MRATSDLDRRYDAADAAEKARAGRKLPSPLWLDSERPDGSVVPWPWVTGMSSLRAYSPEEVLECAEIARWLAIELRADMDSYPGPESTQAYDKARADAARWIAAVEVAHKDVAKRLRALRGPF